MLKNLRYQGIPGELNAEIIQIIMRFHSRSLDVLLVPGLIEALRTENLAVRQSVHQTLKDLQLADYPGVLVDPVLLAWKPEQSAPPGETDKYVRAWLAWWKQANK